MPPSRTDTPIRRRLRVRGVVQGVGFRPFVYSVAHENGLAGFVGNDSRGVFIEVEGPPQAIARLVERLHTSPPPLAAIESIEARDLPLRGERDFVIVESVTETGRATPVSPDISICDDCLKELFDVDDRRYHYPFINCTNCGPRFTIIRGLPYDRPQTTMSRFRMCADCETEYHDPANRRFHAQPNACPVCGPRVWFSKAAASRPGAKDSTETALKEARSALADGRVVAVKGIGGFHLACDARSDVALETLRTRKGRVEKPFAVMARDLDVVRGFAKVNEEEAKLLTSRERPILLLRAIEPPSTALSNEVAPGNRYIGVMLPYSPLHYLLLDETPLVMTSANRSEEPIVKGNDEAAERLSDLADFFLLHDRDIEVACDDSVVRVFQGHELPVRRSRGYAPFPIPDPLKGPAVLAVGGELKSTFCLTRDGTAYLSQHLGDMENLETLTAFERGFRHLRELFVVTPQAVICDLHPGYISTLWARRYAQENEVPLMAVQHHHAHVASLMAEAGLGADSRVLGFAFDGTGYGTDGAIWGGEVLESGYRDFTRLGHLRYVALPGGDAAIRKPYRAALAMLWACELPWDGKLACVAECDTREQALLQRQLERGLNSVSTSSMGRLFDAIASIAGVRQVVSYEAQAAIELECLAKPDDGEPYHFNIETGETLVLDPHPVLARVVEDALSGVETGRMATRLHRGLAEAIVRLAELASERTGLHRVALTGGVFQNVLLLTLATEGLRENGFEVLTHRWVPPNDGGLALGQAMVGIARSH
jgi:hydrogenase maturation protein HypF